MPWQTHTVTNQVPPLSDYNLFDTDQALVQALTRAGGAWHAAALAHAAAQWTRPEALALAEQANRHAPELFTHDARGMRIDALEFHPSWHALLAQLRGARLHALPFSAPRAGAMAARCAGYFMHAQLEAGSLCPITMTFASIAVLQNEPELFAALRDKLFSPEHDPRDLPLPHKTSMLIGMGMTEKQGGSDVRSNRTMATPTGAGGRGAEYRLVGHKWFFSVPQSDAHLVLAQTPGQQAQTRAQTQAQTLSCFYVPRFAPDGSKNPVQIQRLKNKLGNRSNASGEVEFLDAFGILVGAEGRGVPTIIEMANFTRLDCVIGSAALMRAALVQALHHARHREAFGRLLAEQPLMQNVLADLALESEAATLLFMRLAQAFEASGHAPGAARAPAERAWRRVLTPAAKFWVCKRAVEFTGEAMEVWGGNGYVEDSPLARLYREAPVNSIWEGSGNVMCLDVLRALEREPEASAALFAELADAARGQPALSAALDDLLAALRGAPHEREADARRIAQRLVLVAQATLLVRHAPHALAQAFIDTRLGPQAGQHGRVFGTLPPAADRRAMIARAYAA